MTIDAVVPDIYQGEDFSIVLNTTIDGEALAGIAQAKAVLYQKGVAVVTKSLNDGITFNGGKLSISFTEVDTQSISGMVNIECLVRDMAGKDAFVLLSMFNIKKTLTRLS